MFFYKKNNYGYTCSDYIFYFMLIDLYNISYESCLYNGFYVDCFFKNYYYYYDY